VSYLRYYLNLVSGPSLQMDTFSSASAARLRQYLLYLTLIAITFALFLLPKAPFDQPVSEQIQTVSSPPSALSPEKVARLYDSVTQVKAKYKLDKAALIIEARDKNSIRIEVGDPAKTEFTPELKISRWEGEVSFKLKADVSKVSQKDRNLAFDGDIIKYSTPAVEYHFYDKSDVLQEGGYEFEAVLHQKPASNVLSVRIETHNLDFFYQPPLTKQWKIGDKKGNRIVDRVTETAIYDKDGIQLAYRPENVVGSYAVFYTNHPLNQVLFGY
jgi:hypothetical protein